MATAVHSPTSHPHSHSAYRHHTFTPSAASSHSGSTTPRSTLHKQSSSYRTISSSAASAAAATMASYSSQSSAGRPNSSHDSGHHHHLHGKLHKRSTSKETSSTTATGNGGASSASATPTHEEFFPADSSHHKKGLIKPLSLLKKVSSSSGSGKLDLGKADGGYYSSSSSPYIGKQASATDLTSFVPTHRQQHKRTISGNSAGSNNSAPNYYPARRYAPTPSQSYPNSIGDSESAEDDNDDDNEYLETNGTTTAGSSTAGPFARKRAATQPLRVVTSSTGLPLVLPPRIPTSESAPISPITPLNRSATLDSFDRKRNESFDRKRKDSIDRKRKIVGGRNSSEEYVESMKRAREKFEEQERRKDEKEERKARKSLSKDDHHRRRSISKEESRRPSNDGSNTIASSHHGGTTTFVSKTRWFSSARHSTPELGTTTEKTIGIPYGGPGSDSSTPAGGIKTTATRSLRNVSMRAADDGGRRSRSEKRTASGVRGFRHQWQGFVMWVQIGFVRMGRKVRSFFEKAP
ncbi:hypothetical protein Dda_0615 [Drechslerella dactyloides]|uniref:Uncharacterized protein n=1 Tax=Drechslerella dactyloides TaxID=74499 RepID=A0AAD6J6M0_DREDA|nr:hypothetical protein Dda_0615 [Drechslerella dactyloides]